MSIETAIKVRRAAIPFFARLGYDGVSVRDICHATGCSANAVHYHFKSKAGLYQSIMQDFGADLFQEAYRVFRQAPKSQAEFETRLQIFMEDCLRILVSNKELLDIAFFEFVQVLPNCDKSVVETFRGLGDALLHFLELGQKEGWLRAEVNMHVLGSMILDLLAMRALANEARLVFGADATGADLELGQWLRCMFDVFRQGMIASESG